MKISDLMPEVTVFCEEFAGIDGIVSLLAFPVIYLLRELEKERKDFEPLFRLTPQNQLEIVYFEHELVNFSTRAVKDTVFSDQESLSCIMCGVMTVTDDSKTCSSYCQYELEQNPLSPIEYELVEEESEVDALQWVRDELNRVKFDISRIRRAKKLFPAEKKEKLLELGKLQLELLAKLEVA